MLVGLEEIEKSGLDTTSVTLEVCVIVPSVPVMVKVKVPSGVLAVVATVRVEGG